MRSDTIYSLMGIAFLKRSTSFSILWITGDGLEGKKQFPEQRAAHSRNGQEDRQNEAREHPNLHQNNIHEADSSPGV